jgi:hypothetical protein
MQSHLYESQAEIIKDALRRLFLHYEISMVSEEPAVKTLCSAIVIPAQRFRL